MVKWSMSVVKVSGLSHQLHKVQMYASFIYSVGCIRFRFVTYIVSPCYICDCEEYVSIYKLRFDNV